ncbi:MAG: hypothetical protein AVDCRST_MAG13-568, partial [uncultured Solirubrobacteraceae bacterium]
RPRPGPSRPPACSTRAACACPWRRAGARSGWPAEGCSCASRCRVPRTARRCARCAAAGACACGSPSSPRTWRATRATSRCPPSRCGA